MMKVKSLALAASVAGFGLATAAHGDIVVQFAGPHVVGGHGGVTTPIDNVIGTVTGISIEFTANAPTGGSWVSDFAVTVGDYQWHALYGDPANLINGATIIALGVPFPGLPNDGTAGTYTSTSGAAGGTYSNETVDIGFGSTYGFGGWTYTDVTLTIHGVVIPAPGALALLGVAGLAGVSRRRRT